LLLQSYKLEKLRFGFNKISLMSSFPSDISSYLSEGMIDRKKLFLRLFVKNVFKDFKLQRLRGG
ncbi:MAG: hypothetical protein AAFY76_06130, partial [Cyanobacteria bacterium J06649_11]